MKFVLAGITTLTRRVSIFPLRVMIEKKAVARWQEWSAVRMSSSSVALATVEPTMGCLLKRQLHVQHRNPANLPPNLPGCGAELFLGHFQLGSYRYRSLIEGLYTL